MKYHFGAKIEVVFKQESNEKKATVLNTNFNLSPSGNLKKDAYLDKDDTPTALGVSVLQSCLVHAIASSTFYAQQKGWMDAREQYRKIQDELQTAFSGMEGQVQMGAVGEWEKQDKPPQKSTDKELVIELIIRNKQGRYDELIHMAVARYFHDFKSPDDGPAGDKLLLVEILSKFPELADIRKAVIDGVYDEAPDDEDSKKLEELIMPKKTKPPTK